MTKQRILFSKQSLYIFAALRQYRKNTKRRNFGKRDDADQYAIFLTAAPAIESENVRSPAK